MKITRTRLARRGVLVKITRTTAVNLIDSLREIMAERDAFLRDPATTERGREVFAAQCMQRIAGCLQTAGIGPLQPCPGEAHTPEGCYIDNCMLCAPRWGWIGEKIRIT